MNAVRLEEILSELRRALRRKGVADELAIEEAREHLIDAVDDGVRRGLSTEAAEQEAVARFGEPETVAAHFAEGRSPMFARIVSAAAWTCRAATLPPRRAVLVSLLLSAPATLFLTAVLLQEAFGIGTLMAPVETIMATPSWRDAFNIVTPMIFLGGLTLGVILNALAIGRLDLGWRERRLVSTLAVEPRVSNVAFIGAATLMLAVFVGYAFVENFQRVPSGSAGLAKMDVTLEGELSTARLGVSIEGSRAEEGIGALDPEAFLRIDGPEGVRLYYNHGDGRFTQISARTLTLRGF